MTRPPALSLLSCLVAAIVMVVTLGASSTASAVKLRRPYDTAVAFNYGFDNNYGSAGCVDFACGGHCYDGHGGTDHPLVLGSTVRAGAAGTVVSVYNGCANYGYAGSTCGGACGNHVKIRHADGQVTLYCHMRKDSLRVSTGQSVSCGQNIGQTASSGSSTGPHLHVSWRTSSGVDRDLFAGSCTTSPGAWRQQNGYRDPVGTSCGCTPSTEVCDGTDNDCDGNVDEGGVCCTPSTEVCDGTDNNCDGTVDGDEVCEIEFLIQAASSYAAPRTTDVNGDGLQDACGRFGAGWGCRLATGDGWGEKIESDKISDAGGWGSASHYATIRTGDVDGDGLADVCARHSTQGYQCWRSTGSGFEHYASAAGYTNDAGWTAPGYYTTFRLMDVDGDGRDDVCARGPQGFDCQLSTEDGFGATIEGPNWTDDSGFNHAWYYGTIRTGDLNADGRDDVCIRLAAGFRCYTSNGQGFDTFATLADFSNDGGWNDMTYWTTLRLADYDGDGRDDVCARYYSGWKCLRTTDAGFAEREDVRSLPVTSGWDDPTNYATFRVGDVNGDGADDFCARANAGMMCFGLDTGTPFDLGGPEWSDDSGWAKPQFYQTIFMADIGGDRRQDLCGRGVHGLSCRLNTDDGFAAVGGLDDFTDDQNWDQMKYYSTLRLGSGECLPEKCNGFDDDCDGQIDEDVCTNDSDAGSDAGSGADAGSHTPDTGFADSGGDVGDHAGPADTGGGASGGSNSLGGKAACTVGRGGATPTPLVLLLGLPLILFWRNSPWRDRVRRRLRLGSVLLVSLLLTNGCDKPESTDAATTSPEHVQKEAELGSFEPIDADKRLLAVHGDWQLRGQMQPILPHSDAPPRFAVDLVDGEESKAWPLEDEFVTNAVFVPGGESSQRPAALALRMPNKQLLLLDLEDDTVTETDENVGYSVAAAANGCCLAYMKGGMGQQSALRVFGLADGQHRELQVGHNGWSPAISPAGDKVVWVAASPEGHTEMHIHDFNAAQTRNLDIADDAAFPAGPQPPFWTERGIAFAAERGAYLMAPTGEPVANAPGAHGLVVDMASGRFFDGSGKPLSLSDE